jgi:Fe-S-cluster containining protein
MLKALSDTVECKFSLRLGDRVVSARATVPASPARPEDLLPVLQSLTDAVVEAAADRDRAQGRAVSCAAGCGACCRQFVPIAEAEARRLSRLVRDLPEERRSAVENRFRDALARLAAAGLLDTLRAIAAETSAAARNAFGLAYFRAQAPCPFLEAESCSIHSQRPLACREYLVTSPAACCGAPSAETVRLVPLSAKPSAALFALDGGTPRYLPLVLALEWAAAYPAEPEPEVEGPRLLERFLRKLAAS